MPISEVKLNPEELEAEVKRLWHREAFFNATQEIAQSGYCEWDYENDRIKTCTENYARIFGMSIEEAIESQSSWQKVLQQIHPQDRQHYEDSYRSKLGAGSHEVEYRVFRKDGEIRHIKEVGIVVRDGDGKGSDSIGLLQDITAHKKREQDLENRNVLARQVENITDIGHFIWDINADNYIYISPGFARIHGTSVDEYLQRVKSRKDDMADVHGDDREQLAKAYHSGRGQTNNLSLEYRILRSDGETRWIQEQSSIEVDASTKVRLLVGVVQDVTRQKNIEQSLRDARDSLETAVKERTEELAATVNRLKQEVDERERMSTELENQNAELERFAYTVSHDLKAPLVTIKGFVGLLAKDIENNNMKQVTEDLGTIGQAADTMGALLNDLLELSRIGRVMGDAVTCNLTEIANHAVAALTGNSDGSPVDIIIEPMPSVVGDKTRLTEVYQNLIENAIKFMGRQQSPQVRVGAFEQDDMVSCFVRDNGIGIDEEFHEQVFGLFARLHNDVDGTGIGLALVKRIIEVHGGKIWIESDASGNGCNMIFTLPKNT